MVAAVLASVTEALQAVGQYLAAPWGAADWGTWRLFWLEQIFDDRFVVVYFLPLVPLLLLAPRDKLRVAIIFTGVAFLTYLFGVFYAGLWLLTCVVLHWFSGRFAVECRRTDVLPAGPPLAAIAVVTGWYVATMVAHELALPLVNDATAFPQGIWWAARRGMEMEALDELDADVAHDVADPPSVRGFERWGDGFDEAPNLRAQHQNPQPSTATAEPSQLTFTVESDGGF